MRLKLLQGSDSWLEARKNHVTATDSAVILGLNPFKTADKLRKQKLGLIADDPLNERMTYGNENEYKAREVYMQRTSRMAVPSCYECDEHPWLMASLDGITFDESLILEVKCGQKAYDLALQSIIPPYYFAQMQIGMLCSGAKQADYFVWYEGDEHLIRVDRDEKFIEDAIPKLKEFYDGIFSTDTDDLAYQVRDDDEAIQAKTEYLSIKQTYEDYEEKLKQARQKLISLAGEKNLIVADIRVEKTLCKGAVQYERIEQLKGVDLEQFRKEKSVRWTIREIKA